MENNVICKLIEEVWRLGAFFIITFFYTETKRGKNTSTPVWNKINEFLTVTGVDNIQQAKIKKTTTYA